MAHAYHSPTTFCEVTYDSDWFEDDRHFTPYRYSLLRTDTDSNSDTVSLTLPSYTYYEYLRSLYDCRTTATPRHPPGYHVTSACSNGENPPRPATTWHAFGKDTNSELSRQAIRSEPTRIRPTYPFPSLHLIQQGESGEDFDDEIAVTDRAKKKLVWVDALNKWVPETQLHPRPYISFVGNVPVVEKQGKPPKELGGGWEEISPSRLCDRFEVHMGRQKGRSVTPDRLSISNKQRNNDKREAVKKKAEEMAAQRRQRKAYSTPLYTTIAERKHKARVESSRVPHSTPVSPISQQHHQQQLQQQQQLAQLQQQRDRLPVPREVWQPEAKTTKDKSRTESKPSTPTRREISITLTTPKPEEHEQEKPLDESKEKGDRKVTFTEQMKNEKTEKKTKKKKAKRRKVKTDNTKQKSKTKTDKSEKSKKGKKEHDKPERLPITKPSEVELEPDPEPEPQPEPVIKPKSPHRERRKSIIEQRQHLIIKKERRERHCMKDEEEKVKKLPEIDIDVKKIDSWIFDKVDFTEETDIDPSRTPSIEPLPSLSTDLSPEFIEKKKEVKEQRRKSVLAKLIQSDTKKLLRKPGKKDSSYQDELRRLELAEERRKKQMEMYERLKNKKMSTFGELSEDGTTRFDDYGFLSKYCIFTQGTVDVQMYKHAFDAVDEGGTGWLEGEDVMIALRGANNRLTEAEEEYLYRVLELTGYRITHGADFKMFSVLAGLSQKISALDKWMKNMIGSMDFKQLEMKIFKCKELWECNVDKDTNNITLDQLCVELRAGGVSFDHELEVREKLSHLNSLDLLDFLTYVPLFIMIHESVVANPLSDIRNK